MIQLSNSTYSFKITYDACRLTIQTPGNASLHDLAEFIIESIGFDLDHCFAFYGNSKQMHLSEEKYTLFSDMGEPEGDEPGVKETRVENVFTEGKSMILMFDYGDGWQFPIQCTGVVQGDGSSSVMKLIQSTGTWPEQYPKWEE